jgi:hypothetical protein
VVERFGDSIFLSPHDFSEYVGDRKERKMLAIKISSPSKYEVPLKLEHPVTMAGQYMTKRMLLSLKARQRQSR